MCCVYFTVLATLTRIVIWKLLPRDCVGESLQILDRYSYSKFYVCVFFFFLSFFFLRTSAYDANPFTSLKWLDSSDFIFRWTGNNYCLISQIMFSLPHAD